VSYTQSDRDDAEWIALRLEEWGHKTTIQLWDFVPGTNWVDKMNEAIGAADQARLVAVPLQRALAERAREDVEKLAIQG